MKRLFLILFSALLAISAGAQGKRDVIANAGGSISVTGLTYSWTLGETVVPTFKSLDGTLVLTHGFQQQLIVTVVEENIAEKVDVKIYPNPASDVLNILLEEPAGDEIAVILMDSNGRVVKRDVIEATVIEKQLSMQDVSAGLYFLRLVKGKTVNVYKVVKL